MEEDSKVWLGLGEDQIDQSLFLTNAANNIQSYVQSKPWSNKRKQSFLNAYNAIMQTGVTGATNDTGQWQLTTQSQLDPTGLSNRDQEMLGDAAYFILQQMQGVTPRSSESEDSNKQKTKFVGATAFDNWVSNNVFGGRQYSRAQDWNVLDERDTTTGKRGVANRLSRMKDYLTQFRNTLNDNDWDYTDNPTGKNAAEVQARLDRAIAALTGKTEVDQDIIDSLNALGINYRDWFDNGLGEDSGKKDKNGNPLTWQEWQEQQAADAKLKAEADAAKLKAQNEAIKANPWSTYALTTFNRNMKGWSDRDFADKIGTDSASLTAALNDLSGRMGNLTPDEQSMLYGAFRSSRIPKQQVSKEIYNILKRSKRYAGQPISRFSQIPGVDGIVMDNITGQLIYPKNGVNIGESGDWLKGLSDTEKDNKYLEESGKKWTASEKAQAVGIAADILSVVDPEYLTASGLALVGSAARTTARSLDPRTKGFSLGRLKDEVLDYGLSFVGGLPIAGDASLLARAVINMRKVAPWIGAVVAGYNSPKAYSAWQKLSKNWDPKELNVDDWQALGSVFMGVAGIKGSIKGNRITKASGKRVTENSVEVRVKQSDGTFKNQKVKLSEQSAKELKNKFKQAKSDEEANKILREHINGDSELKTQIGETKLEDIHALSSNKLRSNIPSEKFRSSRGVESTERFVSNSGQELPLPTGWRDKIAQHNIRMNQKYGIGQGERQSFNLFGNPYKKYYGETPTNSTQQASSAETNTSETPTNTAKESVSRLTPEEVNRLHQNIKGSKKFLNKGWQKKNFNGVVAETPLGVGSKFTFDTGSGKIQFEIAPNKELLINGEKSGIFQGGKSGNREIGKRISKVIEDFNKKIMSDQNISVAKKREHIKSMGQKLIDLKKAGFFNKQGGKLKSTNQIISEFLKNQK